MTYRVVLQCCAMIGLSWPFVQPQETQEEPAELTYLHAYQNGEVEGLTKYLDEDSLMEDPTAASMGQALNLKGAKEIEGTLTALFKGISNLNFERKCEFASGGFGVSSGIFSYDVPGERAAVDREVIRAEYEVTTVVQFKEGRLVRHTDYANYDGYFRHLENMRKKK